MNCHEVRKLFGLYYDSEGGAELHFQIGDHLAMCRECKSWFQREARCAGAIDNLVARGDADPRLWQGIEGRILAEAPAGRGWTVPLGAFSLVAVAASLVLAAGVWWFVGVRSPDELSRLAAAAHESYVRGHWQADVVSGSVEEVERRLRPKAGFVVRCPPQGQGGFQLKGGGVRRLDHQVTVHIVGEVEEQPVSVFVLSRESLRAFPHLRVHLPADGRVHRCRQGAYEMVASLLHGHVVLVLGRADVKVLLEVLRGYGNHHAGVPGPRHLAMGL